MPRRLDQGGGRQSDRLLQGARPRRGRDDGEGARRKKPSPFRRRGTPGARRRPTRRRRDWPCHVFMPADTPKIFRIECEAYGAHVTLVDGLIDDCGRIVGGAEGRRRVVRRLDAEGAVPRRGEEDDGIRAGRADRAGRSPTSSSTRPAAARASSGCGRRSTRWRSSAGSARSARGWSRSRPRGARRSRRPSRQGRTSPSGSRTRRPTPAASASRRPTPTT